MRIDPRFLVESGVEIFNGAELLLKGCLETPGGVSLLTGYPGSPVAGFFDSCHDIAELLIEHGVAAKMANNEALSVAMVNGAQMVGIRAISVFKSVGLHVAADALALGNLAGIPHPTGGAVIVSGDDPWSDSTQVPADSRFLFEHLRVPVMEPATPQELKDWIALGFDMSVASQLYVGLMVTVALADGGGSVECRPNQWPKVSMQARVAIETGKIPVETTVLLPPRSWRQELTFKERFGRLLVRARELGINKIDYPLERSWKRTFREGTAEAGANNGGGGGMGERTPRGPVGFVASGAAYSMLVDALRELKLLGQFPILKLGISYPVDTTLVDQLAGMVDRIVVVEERRSFIERQIAEHINSARQNAASGEVAKVELWGKEFPGNMPGIPATRGLHPSILIEKLAAFFRNTAGIPQELLNGQIDAELETIAHSALPTAKVPLRTPAYCPGCPHRDSSSALLEIRKDLLDAEYMRVHYGRGPIDLVAHGDTGCYTMMMFEPNKPLMHNYSGMGLGGGTGAGIDPFITNKQLVFMGDGTFFHSGQLAIANSITSNQDITYIILENSTTAMTGHQPNPTLEEDILGNKVLAHDIERIVKSLIPEAAGGLGGGTKHKQGTAVSLEGIVSGTGGGKPPRARVTRMNPAERDNYKETLERILLEDGVKVVIADKECGITFNRRKKREEIAEKREKGFVEKKLFMNVTEEVCEHCLECTNQTGCPALKFVETDYGRKVQTDFSTCVNDGACSRIDACPSFEQVIVTRKRAPRLPDEVVDLTGIPDPPPFGGTGEVPEAWRCYLAGVGGMGIGVAGEILTRAGHKEGFHIGFIDKKGLAIRNGGVFCQLLFSKHPIVGSAQTPWGKADLLIGVDAVEAARAVSPDQPLRVASPKYTRAVVNTGKTPTVLTLMGREDFTSEEMTEIIKLQCQPGQFFGFNVGDLCERLLDSKLYANIMMLGVAYQLGFIPVSYKSIQWAIKHAVGREFERNYRAFNIGRKIVLRPDLFGVVVPNQVESVEQVLERKALILSVSSIFGKGNATAYRELCTRTLSAMPALPEALKRDYVIRVFDAVQWGTLSYAQEYARRITEIYAKDTVPNRRHALTRAAIWNLAKVMMIKDEVYVAMLYTSPEKYKRDRRRFNVNPANGDKITYLHLNKPEFVIGGKSVKFALKGRDWQMRILRHCRWLRDLMPSWHKQEKSYRDWYAGLVDQCAPQDDWTYNRWLEILNSPEQVTGYRDVRYPKMDVSRRTVADVLKQLEKGPSADDAGPSHRSVRLSVLGAAG